MAEKDLPQINDAELGRLEQDARAGVIRLLSALEREITILESSHKTEEEEQRLIRIKHLHKELSKLTVGLIRGPFDLGSRISRLRQLMALFYSAGGEV